MSVHSLRERRRGVEVSGVQFNLKKQRMSVLEEKASHGGGLWTVDVLSSPDGACPAGARMSSLRRGLSCELEPLSTGY